MAMLVVATLAPRAAAQANYEDKDLFNILTLYGDWELTHEFGWVWTPANMPVDFRPYTNGRWIWTADHGWMFDSTETWAWACYHYGRWIESHIYGWIWRPAKTWAPAWVAWKAGQGYIGWAPLPMEATWQDGIGFKMSPNEIAEEIRVASWAFVKQEDFPKDQLHLYVLPRTRNPLLVKDTDNITDYRALNGMIMNASLPYLELEQAIGSTIPAFEINEVANPIEATMPSLLSNTVNVYRPITPTTPVAAAPQPQATVAWREVAAEEQNRDYQDVEIEDLKSQYVDRLRDEQAMREYQENLEWLRAQHAAEQRIIERRQRCRLAPPPPTSPVISQP